VVLFHFHFLFVLFGLWGGTHPAPRDMTSGGCDERSQCISLDSECIPMALPAEKKVIRTRGQNADQLANVRNCINSLCCCFCAIRVVFSSCRLASCWHSAMNSSNVAFKAETELSMKVCLATEPSSR
jgi:hypothetical protein